MNKKIPALKTMKEIQEKISEYLLKDIIICSKAICPPDERKTFISNAITLLCGLFVQNKINIVKKGNNNERKTEEKI
jgi:hypothetical protein